LPTIVWAVDGGDFIHDDWGFAKLARFKGTWQAIRHASPRPLASLYFGLTHGILGPHPLPGMLLLAMLNGVAAALFWLLATRLWGGKIGAWAAVALVVLANRGSTRLWLATAPEVLAVCLLLLGGLLLLRGRAGWAIVSMAAATLAYEGVLALALVALIAWWWQDREHRAKAAFAGLVGLAALGIFAFVNSPKRDHPQGAFAHATQVLPANFGVGVFGPAATVGGVAILAVVAVALGRSLLPSFRASATDRAMLAGLGIFLLAAAPFALSGFPFATDGIFDRANLVVDLGTATIFGAALAALATATTSRLGVVVAAVVALALGGLNATDLHDYRRAVSDGHTLVRNLNHDLPGFDEPLVVGPPLPNRGGVAQFIAYHDLGAALAIKRGDRFLDARIAVSTEDFLTATEPLRYDRVTRQTTLRPLP
jgi:hypothetical protein